MLQKINRHLPIMLLCFVMATTMSCKKYLDEKPDKKLAVPSTLNDLQALLDYYPVLTTNDAVSDEVSADNYYITTASWQGLSLEGQRRIYTWQKDHFFDEYFNDWFILYQKVYYTNTVFDNLKKIGKTTANQAQWDFINGQALMIRSKAFLQTAVIWSLAYDESSADTDPGIPLRQTPDFTEPSVRASLRETFNLILSDLKTAVSLLPVIPVQVPRASRPTTYALIARTYLYMRKYTEALKYADSSLQLKSDLLDYNSLDTTSSNPLPAYTSNPEIDYYTVTYSTHLNRSIGIIDSLLYKSFDVNDLRKAIYFSNNGDGTYGFKGSYDGPFGGQYTGIATDEIYLMRAECNARAGNKVAALNDLDSLLIKRWKTGTFVAVTASDANDALAKILVERRKELIFRFVRWMDIKRLNKENAGITLKRIIDGQTYILPPNDLRFALPIPEAILSLSGIQQNAR